MLAPALTRLPDWRPRLASYLARVARHPFRPGTHDCALFCAGAVEAMTGRDMAAPWRGGYRSLAAGYAQLAASGFADHVSLVRAHFAPVAPASAQVGDLALVASDVPEEVGALGVVQGAGVYVLRPSGLALVSRLDALEAWTV